jgi:hypothetical protein
VSLYLDRLDVLRHAAEALTDANARKFDGDDNFKKIVTIRTAVAGGEGGQAGFVFEARIPRSAVNDLAISATWSTTSRSEAADFLRELAAIVTGDHKRLSPGDSP